MSSCFLRKTTEEPERIYSVAAPAADAGTASPTELLLELILPHAPSKASDASTEVVASSSATRGPGVVNYDCASEEATKGPQMQNILPSTRFPGGLAFA